MSNEYPTPQKCGRSAWRDLEIINQKSVAPFAQSMITRLILNNQVIRKICDVSEILEVRDSHKETVTGWHRKNQNSCALDEY